ncbi:hypothetical protein [Caballeronia sp. INDeC2]|uniref:hypothetical protein n=1 Tax=Caballeronia sp. INDeC2 TaxID=2921747 RepID=UPI002027B959|nr:hypothetical protein [Caballeronia sp. INDeC2]
MKFFNRLAHREFLIIVAVAASALTLHVRQHVADTHTQTPADYGRMCEGPSVSPGKARVLPADCAVRANMRPERTHAPWV